MRGGGVFGLLFVCRFCFHPFVAVCGPHCLLEMLPRVLTHCAKSSEQSLLAAETPPLPETNPSMRRCYLSTPQAKVVCKSCVDKIVSCFWRPLSLESFPKQDLVLLKRLAKHSEEQVRDLGLNSVRAGHRGVTRDKGGVQQNIPESSLQRSRRGETGKTARE